MFPNKNLHIGVPRDKKIGINIDEKIRDILIENMIFDLREFISFIVSLSISFDCSLIDGTIVTASELISVEGIIIIGNVMPMIIPNSDSASELE